MRKIIYFSIHLQEKCVAHRVEAPFAVDGLPDTHIGRKSCVSQHKYSVAILRTELIPLQADKKILVSDDTLFSCFSENILQKEIVVNRIRDMLSLNTQ
jgi:hypothetical protein